MKITAKHRSVVHHSRSNSNSQSNIRKFINLISHTKENEVRNESKVDSKIDSSRSQKLTDHSLEISKQMLSPTPNVLLKSVDQLMKKKAKGISVMNHKSKNNPSQLKPKYSEDIHDCSHPHERHNSQNVSQFASYMTYKIDPTPQLNVQMESNVNDCALRERDVNVKQFFTSVKPAKNYINSVLQTCPKQQQSRHPYHARRSRVFSLKDFTMGHKVGRGRFGNVYLARENTTHCLYAIKMISIEKVIEEDMMGQIINEIKIQTYVSNPNILKMYGYFKDGNTLCMVLQYADEKCLFKHMRKNNKVRPLTEEKAVYYARQVLSALKYLHSEDVLHRDIKPQNLLICEDVVKIGDFGWAAYSPSEKRRTFCGTPDYVSPQIIRGDDYDEKADIWSLGVLLYELVTGHAPFEGSPSENKESDTLNRILKGNLQLAEHISGPLRKLILRILTGNPESRLTIKEIEECEWMKQKEQGF